MPREGLSFEKAVAAVQDLMDPDCTVTHDEMIEDRHGHKRQFDVVIRGKVGGQDILGVIECKDWKRRVCRPAVDQFITKSRDVRANIALMISRNGFSQPALERANHAGMGTMSILPAEGAKKCSYPLGTLCYAYVYYWSKMKLELKFVADDPPVKQCSSTEVTRQGQKALDWFRRELATKHRYAEKLGWANLWVTFDKKRLFRVGEQRCYLRGISCHALRVCEKKKRWVTWHGDAFYDWQNGVVKIPPKGGVTGEYLSTDFSDWEPYEGDIPSGAGPLDLRLKVYLCDCDKEADVPDLAVL